jgi:NAD(P)-dependent dehydrogenase (short-subunit alcohol dehydrogenase family)
MIARSLALNGATVYILGRRLDALQSAAESLDKADLRPVVCDVTSKDSLKLAVDRVQKDAGFINLLVCNAGIGGPQTVQRSQDSKMTLKAFTEANWEISMEAYTRTFEVNTIAVWYTTMAFLELLDEGNKKGNVYQRSQVVAVTSIAGFNKVSSWLQDDIY